MKLLVTKNEYKCANNCLKVSEDLKTVTATSYDWWKYVATDSVGNVFFNDTTYSNCTSKHQSKTRGVLQGLGIHIDTTLHNTREDFSGVGVKPVLVSEIKALNKQITELQGLIKKPRTHKRKNAERTDRIRETEYRIKDLERILHDYVDKKRIPQKTKSLKELVTCPYEKTIDRHTVREINKFKPYFKKDNGKLRYHGLALFLNKYGVYLHEPASPEHVRALRELTNVRGNECIEFILGYRHSKDIIPLLPSIDTPEHTKFIGWLAKLAEHPRNTLLLDKIHTKLVNQLNRKNYVPSEPREFPVSETLLKLEGTKHLRLIKNDRALKAEGRAQSHCIGGKHYIQSCLYGSNHALNYRGYTFYLDSSLRVDQTSGRYNTDTPEKVQEELEKLLKAA